MIQNISSYTKIEKFDDVFFYPKNARYCEIYVNKKCIGDIQYIDLYKILHGKECIVIYNQDNTLHTIEVCGGIIHKSCSGNRSNFINNLSQLDRIFISEDNSSSISFSGNKNEIICFANIESDIFQSKSDIILLEGVSETIFNLLYRTFTKSLDSNYVYQNMLLKGENGKMALSVFYSNNSFKIYIQSQNSSDVKSFKFSKKDMYRITGNDFIELNFREGNI